MGYKECIIFFIDILGSKDRDNFDETYRINKKFHLHLENNSTRDMSHTVYKRTIHTFSDCAYIVYDFKDGIEEHRKDIRKLARIALYNTEALVNEFLSEGFLVRGGATLGKVYYESERSLIFGPGINRAFTLENDIAKFPRIIVDDCIVDLVREVENEDFENDIRKGNVELMLEKKSINGRIIIEDSDGLHHLNYFNTLQMGFYSPVTSRMINELQVLINKHLLSHSPDSSIYKKYEWIKNYLEISLPPDSLHDY